MISFITILFTRVMDKFSRAWDRGKLVIVELVRCWFGACLIPDNFIESRLIIKIVEFGRLKNLENSKPGPILAREIADRSGWCNMNE